METIKKTEQGKAEKSKQNVVGFDRFVNAQIESREQLTGGTNFLLTIYVIYKKKKQGFGVRKLRLGKKGEPTVEDVTEEFAAVKSLELKDLLLRDNSDFQDIQRLQQAGHGIFSTKFWEANILWGQQQNLNANVTITAGNIKRALA